MFLDHYGLVADQGSIYIFVAIVPVTMDSVFKLWVSWAAQLGHGNRTACLVVR